MDDPDCRRRSSPRSSLGGSTPLGTLCAALFWLKAGQLRVRSIDCRPYAATSEIAFNLADSYDVSSCDLCTLVILLDDTTLETAGAILICLICQRPSSEFKRVTGAVDPNGSPEANSLLSSSRFRGSPLSRPSQSPDSGRANPSVLAEIAFQVRPLQESKSQAIHHSAPVTPRGNRQTQWEITKNDVLRKNKLFAVPRHADDAVVREFTAKTLPVCGLEPMAQSRLVTGVKTAIYVHVLNAMDLLSPVKPADFDLLVKAGPGNPLFEIEERSTNRLFKVLPVSGETKGDSKPQISLTIGTSGVYQIGLNCRRCVVIGTPLHLEVERSVASVKYTVANGPEMRRTIAGKPSRFEVLARDQDGNRRKKGGDVVEAVFRGPGVVELAAIRDLKNGIYDVSYRALQKGWYDLSVELNGVALEQSPYHLYVSPADISTQTTCLATAALKIQAVAGDETWFLVQGRDVYGNSMDAGGAVLMGSLLSSTTTASTSIGFTDLRDGTYKAAFVGEAQGRYKPRVQLRLEDGNVVDCPLFESLEVEIVPGEVSPVHCILEPGTSNSASTPCVVAGEWARFVLTTNDQFSNPRWWGGCRVECVVKVDVLRPSILSDGKVGVSSESEARHLLESSIAQSVTDEGNGRFLIAWKCPYASSYALSVFVNGSPIRTTNVITRISPAASDARQSWIEGDGSSVTVRGVLTTFRVVAADCFGNRRHKGGDQLQVDFAGPTYFSGSIVDNLDGSYTISYASRAAGRFALHVVMNGIPVGGRSYSVYIRDAVTLSGCFSITQLTKRAVANQRCSFQFVPLDGSNRPCRRDSNDFSIKLQLKPESAFKSNHSRFRCSRNERLRQGRLA